MIDAARNKIRVKACYVMMAATIGACLIMVILGKRVSACLALVIVALLTYAVILIIQKTSLVLRKGVQCILPPGGGRRCASKMVVPPIVKGVICLLGETHVDGYSDDPLGAPALPLCIQ